MSIKATSVDLITAPTGEPVSIWEARTQCRVTGYYADNILYPLITAAREYIEHETGRALLSTTLDAWYPRLGTIETPRGKLQSVTGVYYRDADDIEQTLSTDVYRVNTSRDPGRITLEPDQSWPTVYKVEETVRIRLIAGYGEKADIPMRLKQAMLIHVQAHWNIDSREYETLSNTVRNLISSYRIHNF